MGKPTKAKLMELLGYAEAEIARLRASDSERVSAPNEATEAIRNAITEQEQEQFVVLLLDARQKILAAKVVALGTLNQVDVHPRDVFRDAIRIAAHAIILGHNHPSGVPEPSEADIYLTKRFCEAGKIVGIPVLDHVIVTRNDWLSLAAVGLVPS